jgi:hypothetical protein
MRGATSVGTRSATDITAPAAGAAGPGSAGCADCSPGNGNLRRCVSIATANDRVHLVTLGARFRHPQFGQWLTQLVGGQRLGARRRASSG